jgi:hypothetical protein
LIEDLQALHADRGELSPREYRDSVVQRSIAGKVPQVESFDPELFSEPMSKLLHDDLRVMQRQGGGTPLTLEEQKAWAARTFAEMDLKEATDMRKWGRVISQGGKEAEQALLKGDVAGAFKAKNEQFKSHLLAREAKNFSEEVIKGIRPIIEEKVSDIQKQIANQLATAEPPEPLKPRYQSDEMIHRRYRGKKWPDQVPAEYTAHIKQLMQRAGIATETNQAVLVDALKRSPGGKNLAKFIEEKNRAGAGIQASADLQDMAWGADPKGTAPIKTMSVKNYRDLFESIRSLDYNGRMEKLVIVNNKLQEMANYKNAVVDNVTQLPLRQRDVLPFKREKSTLKGVKHQFYRFDSMMTAPEYIIDDLDLRDPMGPLNQGLFRAMQDAQHYKDKLMMEVGKYFINIKKFVKPKRSIESPFMNPMTRTETDPVGKPFILHKHDVPYIAAALGNDLTRKNILHTLLQEKYLEDPVGSAKMVEDWVESYMTPQDWEAVQSLWNFFDTFQRDHVDPLFVRTTGVIPDPVPLTPWNGHSGGIFPVVRDDGIPVKSDSLVFNFAYRPTTTAKAYTRPPEDLVPLAVTNAGKSLGYVVKQIVHDVAYRETIINSKKILSQPDIRMAIAKHYGHEYLGQLDTWLHDVANSYTVDGQKLGFLNSLSQGLRRTMAVQALGLNTKVLLTPNAGPIFGYLLKDSLRLNRSNFWYNFLTSGVLNAMTFGKVSAFNRMWKFAMENSPDLRNRILHVDRDAREAFDRLAGQRGVRPQIAMAGTTAAMWTTAKIDQFLGMMLWTQEYNNVFLKGKGYFGPTRTLYDHDVAVQSANKLFRKWFGAFSPVNLPAVMRQSEVGKLATTLFYSYGSTMYQVQRDTIRLGRDAFGRTHKGQSHGRTAAFSKMMGMSGMFIVLPAILGYMYNPDIIEDDDSWATVAGKLLLGAVTNTAPIMRDIGAAAMGGSFRATTPAVQLYDQLSRGLKAALVLTTEGKLSANWLKELMTAGGILSGLPMQNPGRAAQFIWNQTTGHDTPHDFMDWVNGIMYGTTKGKHKTGHLLDAKIARKRKLFP